MSDSGQKPGKRPHSEISPVKQGDTVPLSQLKAMLDGYGLNTLKDDLKKMQEAIEFSQNCAKEANDIAVSVQKENTVLKSELDKCKQELVTERESRLMLECHSRRSNLRFYGVKEPAGKEKDTDCEKSVLEIIKEKSGIETSTLSIERCHRLGKKTVSTQPRPIIIKFSFFKDRQNIWSQRNELKKYGLLLKEDFPPEIERRRKILMPVFLAALNDTTHKPKLRVAMPVDKLYINNETYTVDTLHRVPDFLKPENTSTRKNDKAVWFWRKESPFSNHHMSGFMEKGVHYNCTEQYLMVHKAREFGDENAASKIMNSSNPVEQKRTHVENLNVSLWHQVAQDVMLRGLRLKFEQNEHLRQILLDTGCRQIAEASPYDNYWGCGFGMNDPKVSDPSNWTGQNLLGKCLMRVRSELK